MTTDTTEAERSRQALAAQARELETLDRLSRRFGASLSEALSGSAQEGRGLSGVLAGVASSLGSLLAKNVGSTLQSTLSSALQMGAQSITASLTGFNPGGIAPFARGGVVSGGGVVPFAEGGIVSSPSYFPLGRGLGLMGEAGAEAIMPLARGADGRLGIRAGGAGVAAPITVNIATADLESFQRSEAQVSAALARAVARGRRAS